MRVQKLQSPTSGVNLIICTQKRPWMPDCAETVFLLSRSMTMKLLKKGTNGNTRFDRLRQSSNLSRTISMGQILQYSNQKVKAKTQRKGFCCCQLTRYGRCSSGSFDLLRAT